MVVAHPDDDAYGCGGTVALHADDASFRFVLVHATDGAQGDIRPGFPATRESLGSIRRQEDARAWAALGRVPDRHEWLDYPDGRLDAVPFDDLVAKVADIIRQERPTVVVTFGPDGITGHPDHVRIGMATDTAFHRVRAEGGPGLDRLLHGALPQSVFERWNATRARTGLPTWDPASVYDLRGVPDEEIAVSVDVSSVADRIVAGLRQHDSQLHVIANAGVSDEMWAKSVSMEHLVMAWPPRLPGEARLTSMFEGLDEV